MATDDTSSSSDEEFRNSYLIPQSWKQKRESVQTIDILSPGGQGTQNLDYSCSSRNNATQNNEVVPGGEVDTADIQNSSIEKPALESLGQIQHAPSDVSEVKNEIIGTASPVTVKSDIEASDKLHERHTGVQDAECQTVLTAEHIASLEKTRDVGSQTIGTGDVISLNLYYGNLSRSRLCDVTCDPLVETPHDYTTLQDIEKYLDVFQGKITQSFQTVSHTVVTNRETQVDEAEILNQSHIPSTQKIYRLYTSFIHTAFFYILLFFAVHYIRNVVSNTGFFLTKKLSSIYNKLFV